MSNHLLSVQDLTKIFYGKTAVTAVDRISFELKTGETLGLLGPNGAGKTTIIRMLLSILRPTSGEITYFGRNFFEHRSETLQHIAFASTYTNLPFFLTVRENLDIHGRLYGIPGRERKKRSDELLSYFRITQLAAKRLTELSAGQRTCVKLAKAFIPRPRIALLDEPSASLDPEIAEEARKFLIFQRKEYGVAMIFTSHNMDEVATLCDRIIFLSRGRIIAQDTPERLTASVKDTVLELVVESGMETALALIEKSMRPFVREENCLRVDLAEDSSHMLIQELVRAGVNLKTFAIHRPSLQDYFVKVARQ